MITVREGKGILLMFVMMGRLLGLWKCMYLDLFCFIFIQFLIDDSINVEWMII